MSSNGKALAIAAGTLAGLGGALLGYYLWESYFSAHIHEEDDGGANSPVYLNIKILKEDSGVVIGRGGSNIKEIEFKTSTKINFKDECETGSHRVISIRGTQENVELAEILIRQTILNQPSMEVSTLKIPGKSAGCLIGKNGCNIKNIRNTSRCKINVDRNEDASGLKSVELRGTAEQVALAKRLIQEFMSESQDLRKKIRNTSLTRPSRDKTPLFLTSDQNDNNEDYHLSPRNSYLEELLPGMNAQNDAIEVYVSSANSPDSFHVQKVGSMSVKLDKLVQEMSDFYGEEVNREAYSVEKIEVEDIVACKFYHDDLWYRCRVLNIREDEYDPTNTTYEVEFVDFGDSEIKRREEIFDLKTEFLKLNFQAIACRLSSIKHLDESEGWSEDCMAEFNRLTHCSKWEVLLAKISEYGNCKEGIRPSLQLFELKGSDDCIEDVNIGDELIRLGLAKPS